ncbi:MAG: MFS transporter [Burkholderiales bacterium]|nr:MFS transporter [Burkholderiales bacterium]
MHPAGSSGHGHALHARLSLFYFAYFAMLGAYAPYFGLYLQSLRFTPEQIGMLLALVPVVRIVAPALWAWVADHRGAHRQLVLATTLAATVVSAGFLLGTSFAWLFVVLLLLNVFWSASLPLVEASTFGHLRGHLGDYGRIRVWGSISFILAVALLGPLFDRSGIALLPILILALFALLSAAAWALPPDPASASHAHEPLGRIMLRPEVIVLFAACFLMAVAHGPYHAFYSIHLVENGYSKSAVGMLWAVSVIAEILVFLWMPRILGRFSIAAVIAISLLCAVVRFAAIGWAVDSAAVIALAQLLHAATFGAHHAAALAAIHHFFKGRYQARGQALYSALGFGAGGAVGMFASGWLWTHLGPALTFACGSAAALLAFVLVAARLRLPRIATAAASGA